MDAPPPLIRMNSASYACCYGNDVYSFQVRNPNSAVIFFPGDIQDAEAIMIQSNIAKIYTDFSYEETLQILHKKFPNSNIFIVRPSLKSEEISLYGKYLNCDQNGNVESYDPNGNAANALYHLIDNYLCNNSDDLPIILLGFSRGGLVLNQMLVEFGTTWYTEDILKRIREIHWLDCGNGVHDMCYPTLSPVVLNQLHYYKDSIRCYFHMTPYLYKEDDNCQNYAEFVLLKNQLESIQIPVWHHFYQTEFIKYGALSPLNQHFSLLYEFLC